MKCQYKKGFYQQPERSNDLVYLRKRSTAGIMPFGSYRQVVHNSPLVPRTTYGVTSHESPSSHDQGPWACDYCQVATFQTFEEASQHEQTCSMNQDILSVEAPISQLHFTQDLTQLDPRRAQTLLLTMPGDKGSLSDRQCHVRSQFVELFAACESDVASRHSKGAQKLHVDQIGIRCKHCTHIVSKDRAERAICYPSSISRSKSCKFFIILFFIQFIMKTNDLDLYPYSSNSLPNSGRYATIPFRRMHSHPI